MGVVSTIRSCTSSVSSSGSTPARAMRPTTSSPRVMSRVRAQISSSELYIAAHRPGPQAVSASPFFMKHEIEQNTIMAFYSRQAKRPSSQQVMIYSIKRHRVLE